MKALFISLCLSLLMILSSCEGRTGYLDEGQQNSVAMLTDVEWLVVYVDYSVGNEQTFDDETNIYSFGRDTKGWTATGSLKDPAVKKDVRYFQWTFTTENYSVIIEKLTPDELWVVITASDPVLYPNQYKTYYRLKARKRQ